MKRREVLALPLVALACEVPMYNDDEDGENEVGAGSVAWDPASDAQFGLQPWHMWGSSETVSFTGGTAVRGQLARINYGRPETWRFLFEMKLLSTLAGGQFAQANFIVIAGIGRTAVTLDPFATLVIRGAAAPGAQVWRTRIMQPVTSPSPWDANVDEVIPTELVTAQDLQCTVQFFGTADLNIKAEVTALFSPNVHTRPEWNLKKPSLQFRGGEQKGT